VIRKQGPVRSQVGGHERRPEKSGASNVPLQYDVTMKCSHVAEIVDVTPSAEGCEECLAMGDEWVHLRICLICGHVGCCDSSTNKHATKHFHATGHPIVQSFQPGEDWRWCYVDSVFV
jgi:uncharacterized UBP type Zn finger protein